LVATDSINVTAERCGSQYETSSQECDKHDHHQDRHSADRTRSEPGIESLNPADRPAPGHSKPAPLAIAMVASVTMNGATPRQIMIAAFRAPITNPAAAENNPAYYQTAAQQC